MNIEKLLENSKIVKNNINYNVQMKEYTTFKIGGLAECLIKIQNVEELKEILKIAKENKIQLTIIGNGSNILVDDEGIKGITLKIDIKKLEIEEDKNIIRVIVGSGNKLGELSQKMFQKEVKGMEFAAGIPGTIGGAIRMNAGAYGSEMKDILV